MRVVIVGGGIAGVSTASALRALGFEDPVTLIDAGPFPHDRPPLTKEFLAGRSDAKQIALQPPEWYDRQEIELLAGTTAEAIRPALGTVELTDGRSLPADRVVLATGGLAQRPAGLDLPQLHTLRTIADAERLRPQLVPGACVLVIGAGLIGAETASTAAELGCEVTLVDPVAAPLAEAVGAELAAWLHARHGVRGVATVRTGVASMRARDSGLEATLIGESSARLFDVVVLAVGMVPDTRLATAAGLLVERGVVVDALQRSSHPAVLSVGDSSRTGIGLEHWEAARSDGERAAATLIGREAPPKESPWFWTDRHGNHIEVVGRMADAERIVTRGGFDDPAFAVFGLRGDRMVAAAAVDDSSAVRAARRLIERSVPVDPGSLIDRSLSLRALLRTEGNRQ
jgi:3-phenylpropionate/trans-cinnamate dioxygenase ferredoxin reductase component